MFRSLHMKLVMIMLLLVTSLMAVVGAFLMTSVTNFYIDDFYEQMSEVFGESNAAFVSSLREEAAQEDGAARLQTMLEAYSGTLSIDSRNRNYYVLDGRIEQVMLNVLSNAVKYTPDGGHIRVTAGSEGETVWMEVADDGIGIPEADRSRIFERFYRVDKARSRESGGTGLGLSIATEIVQRHHGSLTLVDRPGPGTTVRLELPITQPIGREDSHE